MTPQHLEQRALQHGIVTEPKLGLLILGRKRPGFDPEWGAEVTGRIHAALDQLPWQVHVPSSNIADPPELERAVQSCRADGVTVLLVVQPTISDGRLAPVLAGLWKDPVVLWATTEKPTGAMISANSLVGTHVMAATLRQLGKPLEFVYGHPDDGETRAQLHRALAAVHAAGQLTGRSYGLVGYHAPGFVDFHADPVFLSEQLNSHLFHLSTAELIAKARAYENAELWSELEELRALGLPYGDGFGCGGDGDGAARGDAELEMQARYYRAFRELFAEQGFDALAFRCWPDLPTQTGHWPYLALAKLVSEGYPIAMEGDLDGALGSRIAESLGIGPVYLTDWLEHTRDSITIWHTGAAPFQLCDPVGSETGPRLGVQFNNRLPTVVEANIRGGMDATVFRLWRFEGRYFLASLEGRTAEPERARMATNGRFETSELDVREWFEEMLQLGMPHHLCVVEGRHAETLRRVARLIGAEEV